jgi:hypothetical protein
MLSTYTSWRWIFLINVPMGIAGLLLARRLVPDVRATAPERLDWRGFLLLAAGVAALVVTVEDVGHGAPDWRVAAVGFAVAAGLSTAAVMHLLRTPNPLVDLRTLQIGTYRVTTGPGSVFRAVITAIPAVAALRLAGTAGNDVTGRT